VAAGQFPAARPERPQVPPPRRPEPDAAHQQAGAAVQAVAGRLQRIPALGVFARRIEVGVLFEVVPPKVLQDSSRTPSVSSAHRSVEAVLMPLAICVRTHHALFSE